MRIISAGLFTGLVGALALVALGGCVTSSETAGAQTLTAHVGQYGAAPGGIDRPRVGVPPFKTSGSGSSAKMDELAAEQLTTLLVNSDRFEVIERSQLDQLLQEQGLEGIVKAGEMARPAEVRGVDYLMIGKVTNFRLKAEKAQRGFGLGRIPIPGAGNLGVFDFKRKDSTITAECGVDIRLVDPTTGSIAAAKSKDYKRTDSIGAFGIDILGANADADATLTIDEDDQGLVLRLALDDALRDMMPIVDRALRSRVKTSRKAEAAAPAEDSPDPGSSLVPTDPPAGGATSAKFCGDCGEKLTPGTKFCGKCGMKVSG